MRKIVAHEQVRRKKGMREEKINQLSPFLPSYVLPSSLLNCLTLSTTGG